MAAEQCVSVQKGVGLGKLLAVVDEAHGSDGSDVRDLISRYADDQVDQALDMAKRLRDGRKLGQINGARANKEAADRRRDAIKRQAQLLWAQEPRLRFNLVATARKIEALKLPALRNGKNAFLGVDAIRKHLTTFRQNIL